jgi:hypothetical protein
MVVKNTFISIEEGPPVPDMRRAHTAPSQASATTLEDPLCCLPLPRASSTPVSTSEVPGPETNFDRCCKEVQRWEREHRDDDQADGSHTLVVKNTFISVEEAPPVPDMLRAQTVPSHASAASTLEDPHCERPNASSAPAHMPEPGPEPEPLDRLRTEERWEHCDGCWAADGTPEFFTREVKQDAAMSLPWPEAVGTATVPVPPPEGATTQAAAVAPQMVPVMVPMAPVALSPLAGSAEGPIPFSMAPTVANMVSAEQAWPGVQQYGAIPVGFVAWPTPVGESDHPAAAETTAQAQGLTQVVDSSTGMLQVQWNVDARKLRGSCKQAVSPPFDLNFGSHFPRVPFKIVIYPKSVNDGKGGACFKKARGRGFLQLKCEAQLSGETVANVTFRFSLGSGKRKQDIHTTEISHNFAAYATCDTCRTMEWDFNEAVDEDSGTFSVQLEIVPHVS